MCTYNQASIYEASTCSSLIDIWPRFKPQVKPLQQNGIEKNISSATSLSKNLLINKIAMKRQTDRDRVRIIMRRRFKGRRGLVGSVLAYQTKSQAKH